MITGEIVELAKDLGFPGLVYIADVEGSLNHIWITCLQKWLREEKKLVITVNYDYVLGEYSYIIGNEAPTIIDDCRHSFKTYEEALEKGIEEALKLIK